MLHVLLVVFGVQVGMMMATAIYEESARREPTLRLADAVRMRPWIRTTRLVGIAMTLVGIVLLGH